MLRSQLDLFAEAAHPSPSPADGGYRADEDGVRSRLHRILSEARAASSVPWDAARVALYRRIVPQMSRWLPAEEAAQLRKQFAAEMARLEGRPEQT